MKPYLQHDGPIAFAHRGGAKLWPENTLRAFRGAMDLGIRWMETDVHLSADGHVMVFHDHTLERCTNGTGPLKTRTRAELQDLDAAWHFERDGRHPYRGTGDTIPTLGELLDLAPDLRLNLEIKQQDPPMIEPLWRFLQERDCLDRVLVASAIDSEIQAFRRVAGDRVATSSGKDEIAKFWLRAHTIPYRSVPFDALQVPNYWKGAPVVTRRFVRAAHRLGVQVHVWTIDEPAEMQRLLGLGADAIMSDRPDRLVQVMGR